MVRARLRREHPEWSDQELDQRMLAWLHERPGHGDAQGNFVVKLHRKPA